MSDREQSDLFTNFVFSGLDCFDVNKVRNGILGPPCETPLSSQNSPVDGLERWTEFKSFCLRQSKPLSTVSSLITMELCAYLSNSIENEFGITGDDVKKLKQLVEKIEDICLPRIILKFERFKLLSFGNLVVSESDVDLNNYLAALKVMSSVFGIVSEDYLKDIVRASSGINDFCREKLLGILDSGFRNSVSQKSSHLNSVCHNEDANKSQSVTENVQATCNTELMTPEKASNNNLCFTGNSKMEYSGKEEFNKSQSVEKAKGKNGTWCEKRKKTNWQITTGEMEDKVCDKRQIMTTLEFCPAGSQSKPPSQSGAAKAHHKKFVKKRKKPSLDSFELTELQNKCHVTSCIKEDKNSNPNNGQILPQNTGRLSVVDVDDTKISTVKTDEKVNSSLKLKEVNSKKSFKPLKTLYSCGKCPRFFSLQSSYKLHQKTHRQRKCEFCEASFQGQAKLDRHRLTHTGEKPHRCQTCGSLFADKSHLNVHARIHSMEKPFKCDICKSSFSESTKLKNHKRIHSGEKPYKCQICHSSFSVSSSMKSHMKIHSGQKPFKCQFCHFATKHMSNLKTHMLLHTGEKKYVCDICGVPFSEKAKLRRHKMVHTGERPYNCEVCGTRFADKSHLTVHLRIHSGEKPFKCSHCPSAFIESSKLKNHLRTHTGEKPYICEVCGKSFAVSYSLKSHLRRHTGEKPYKCKFCGYATSQSSNLKTHMLIHNGSKPHVCADCGASFSESSKLNRHKKIHLDLEEEVHSAPANTKMTVGQFPQNVQQQQKENNHFIHQGLTQTSNNQSTQQSYQQTSQHIVRNSEKFGPNIRLSAYPLYPRHNEQQPYRSNHTETGAPVLHNHQNVQSVYQQPFENSRKPDVYQQGGELRELYQEPHTFFIDQHLTTQTSPMLLPNVKLSSDTTHSMQTTQSSNLSSLYKTAPYQQSSSEQLELDLVNL